MSSPCSALLASPSPSIDSVNGPSHKYTGHGPRKGIFVRCTSCSLKQLSLAARTQLTRQSGSVAVTQHKRIIHTRSRRTARGATDLGIAQRSRRIRIVVVMRRLEISSTLAEVIIPSGIFIFHSVFILFIFVLEFLGVMLIFLLEQLVFCAIIFEIWNLAS